MATFFLTSPTLGIIHLLIPFKSLSGALQKERSQPSSPSSMAVMIAGAAISSDVTDQDFTFRRPQSVLQRILSGIQADCAMLTLCRLLVSNLMQTLTEATTPGWYLRHLRQPVGDVTSFSSYPASRLGRTAPTARWRTCVGSHTEGIIYTLIASSRYWLLDKGISWILTKNEL